MEVCEGQTKVKYDYPIFKRLSSNDTGAAPGHQGGIVVPKDLEDYFPPLANTTSAQTPTVDCQIDVLLAIGGDLLGHVDSRYQYQTWGGTRSPERRLTSNLGAIRNQAHAGDYLFVEREVDDFRRMKLTLIRQGTPEYEAFRSVIGNRKWGPVNPDQRPLTNGDIEKASAEEEEREAGVFEVTPNDPRRIETRSKRLARDRAFRNRILALYDNKCAFTERSLASPSGRIGIDAAHVVPLHAGGADDARNGLALSKEIHWAFDNGILTVDGNRTVFVPIAARSNEYLSNLHGKRILEANIGHLRVDQRAFDWHREKILERD